MSRDVYFSFFMFTADLRPDDREYAKIVIERIHRLRELGYAGFDLPLAPTDAQDRGREVESYAGLKQALDEAGLDDVGFTTNVAATRTFDPSSMYKEQRDLGSAYLRSRVDITAALGGTIMAGPIIFPYNVFPTTDANQPIWTDALQEWVIPRYRNARPILDDLGAYAQGKSVKLAIEPVNHRETPAPNLVSNVMDFLENVPNRQVGVCIDSAHVVLGSDGPAAFTTSVQRLADEQRVNYVHISAPDRGAVHDSWIPWSGFLEPILTCYEGPLLVETFNAIPVFLSSLHLTRRKFWIPGEDPESSRPSAYQVAEEALAAVRRELSQLNP